MFELNLTAFGYGLGFVMVGWMAGLIVSYAFTLARATGRLGSGGGR
jgi:hypothetical protein